jgi:hypothetical protein
MGVTVAIGGSSVLWAAIFAAVLLFCRSLCYALGRSSTSVFFANLQILYARNSRGM